MNLNDSPSLRERDELLAHLVDDGTISAEECEYCENTGIETFGDTVRPCTNPNCQHQHQWVMRVPSRPGPDGWSRRCKLCGAYEDISAAARAEAEAEYRERSGGDGG